ncbi:MAG TPA: peptidoglycan editing factor PgeF [bacterium]|nr:peptidoglycan editing factor PgeF [bacterium]HOL35828.1 peptidoglycan editing factor PgeF [bacterium]HPP07883.1 peptidoglycan editing factor PgeF [bacterium]
MNYSHLPYYISFDEIPVFNFCTTRSGGLSTWPFETCNLGFNTDDSFEKVRENRVLTAARLGISPDRFLLLKQVHSDIIHHIGRRHCGKFLDTEIIEGDGMFTEYEGLTLAVTLADCVGIVLYEPVRHVAGVCHSGWKGCDLNICGKLVDKMAETCGCDSGKIIAGISPAICKNCYNVGSEIIQKFSDKYRDFISEHKDGWHLDLEGIVVSQLIEKGVKKENILISRICTYENTHVFYSHRAEKNTGRFIFGIHLTTGSQHE